jgi:hypothetical protein
MSVCLSNFSFRILFIGSIISNILVSIEVGKTDSNTISRTFPIDKNTDLAPIQIGARYHAYLTINDLIPLEGQECEKRLVKSFENINSLPTQ